MSTPQQPEDFNVYIKEVIAKHRSDVLHPDIKALIAELIELHMARMEEQLKTMLRTMVLAELGTPRRQVDAVKQLVLNTLYSHKGEKRIRAVVSAQLSEDIKLRRSLWLTQATPDAEDATPAPPEPLIYHSCTDIRSIITDNLDDLRSHPMFTNTDFTLPTLKAYIKSRTTLRKDDTDSRLTHNVSNAVARWPSETTPFERTQTRGRYRLRAWTPTA